MTEPLTPQRAAVKAVATAVAILGFAVVLAGIVYGFTPTGVGCGSGFFPEDYAGDGCEIATTDRKAAALTLLVAGGFLAVAGTMWAVLQNPKVPAPVIQRMDP